MAKNLIGIGMVWVFLWLTGCGQVTPDVPATPSPLPTATVTEVMPTVPPLEETWDASPVLAYLYEAPSILITPENHWMGVSDVVLYRDGRVITNQRISNRDGERWVLESTQLSQPELCQWLFDIEKVGFFDFAPSDYKPPSVTDSNTTYFSVRGWREQFLEAYAFTPDPVTEEDAVHGVVKPIGMIEGYWLLKRLQDLPAQSYIPERVQVLLYPMDYEIDESEPWTLQEISLAERMAHYHMGEVAGREMAVFEVAAQDIPSIWSFLGEKRWGFFHEGDTTYRVLVRPLLSLDVRTPMDFDAGSNSQYATEPTESMTCQSS